MAGLLSPVALGIKTPAIIATVTGAINLRLPFRCEQRWGLVLSLSIELFIHATISADLCLYESLSKSVKLESVKSLIGLPTEELGAFGNVETLSLSEINFSTSAPNLSKSF